MNLHMFKYGTIYINRAITSMYMKFTVNICCTNYFFPGYKIQPYIGSTKLVHLSDLQPYCILIYIKISFIKVVDCFLGIKGKLTFLYIFSFSVSSVIK